MKALGWTALVFWGAAWLSAAELPSPHRPQIAVDPLSFNFGRALAERTLEKEFTIRNFGDRELVIEDVKTTCGCTAALMKEKVIRPGGRTPLRVTFSTGHASGRVVRSILIRSNDPVHPAYEIQIEATLPDIGRTPR